MEAPLDNSTLGKPTDVFTDELAAEATASRDKIILATLNDLYG